MRRRFLGALSAAALDNPVQYRIHVFRHTGGIATDVKVRAGFQPGPEFARVLQHPVLDVNFYRLIARKRQVQAGEMTVLHPGGELFFVKKICRPFLIAEEEPVLSLRAGGLALFEKGAKWR